jgi:hypothetical protein
MEYADSTLEDKFFRLNFKCSVAQPKSYQIKNDSSLEGDAAADYASLPTA